MVRELNRSEQVMLKRFDLTIVRQFFEFPHSELLAGLIGRFYPLHELELFRFQNCMHCYSDAFDWLL